MDRLRFAAEFTRKRTMHSSAAPTNAVAGVPGRTRTLIIVRPLALSPAEKLRIRRRSHPAERKCAQKAEQESVAERETP